MLIAAVAMIVLDGLDGQAIYVNPREVVSVRAPTSELLHSDIKCTLQTADGKLINVANVCDEVLRRIGKAE
jgi:uncharacterized protein YlzI (FlbEa/FlbD family)